MSEVRDKLKSLLANRGVMLGADWRVKAEELGRLRAEGAFEIHTVVPGQLVGEPEHGFYLVREDFPLDTQHGPVLLGAALDAIPEHIALSACDSDLDQFDPATACFIDTETTGLSGGTGTVPFLVGIGYFVEGAFRLEQCFMRDFDDEEPMLNYLDERFRQCETIVSYNGKSFDLPLLRTRFISNRIRFRLDSLSHFDLVHAARRFWRARLQDCSLGNIERCVLNIVRHGDVPSSEIPALWFDYLRTRDARELGRVFYHHKTDILSLVSLTAILSQWIEQPGAQGFTHAEDRLALVRLQFRQRRFLEAAEQARELLATELPDSIRRDCIELMALAMKRAGEWDRMEEAWRLLLEYFPNDLPARLELAKHYEHRTRNLIEAARLCSETIQLLETRSALNRNDEFDALFANRFQFRLNRIRRKTDRYYRKSNVDSDPEQSEFAS